MSAATYETAAGSTVSVCSTGSWVSDWDWSSENETCMDARPIAIEEDEGRVLVTVACPCCPEQPTDYPSTPSQTAAE